MYVCICNAVTEREIRACAAAGARSLEDLQATIEVATCCGQCADAACDLLAQCHDERHANVVTLYPRRFETGTDTLNSPPQSGQPSPSIGHAA